MRGRLIGILAVAAVFLITGGLGSRRAAVAQAPATQLISMVNNSFRPGTITIAAGTTVVWENDEDPNGDNVTHDVLADDLTSWNSDYLNPGDSFSMTFTTPGVYNYLCDLHQNMSGTIIVQ